MTTIIISDLHLGSPLCRAKLLLQTLQGETFDRLILNGDIFADLNFRRLNRDQFELLNYLRILSNPKRNIEVIWIEDNHDWGLIQVMSHLVGIPACKSYKWKLTDQSNENCLAMHGHQFDEILSRNPQFSELVSFLYLQLLKLRPLRAALNYIDAHWVAGWQRISLKVSQRAIAMAKKEKMEYIFCGHTHQARSDYADGITYHNSGSWVDAECSYIRIDNHGKIDIRKVV